MTFIASVKARNGVAIIADSLVTVSMPIITFEKYKNFVRHTKQKNIDLSKIEELFEEQAHHTNDYEEKLVKFDNYTAVTIAGSARIINRRMSEIILSFTKSKKDDNSYNNLTFEKKIQEFCKFFETIIQESGIKDNIQTIFIFSNFNPEFEKTKIIQIKIVAEPQNGKTRTKFIESVIPDAIKLVMAGQNAFSNSLIYGIAPIVQHLQKVFIDSFIEEAKIKIDKEEKEEVLKKLTENIYMNHPFLFDEIQAFKIRELSIQEAVNLAYLLLKVEMDFQNYTQEIPTIGGVIRIATIDSSGYKDICGNDTNSPV